MLARIAYSFSNLPKFYQLKINVGVGMVYAKIKKRDIELFRRFVALLKNTIE